MGLLIGFDMLRPLALGPLHQLESGVTADVVEREECSLK